MSSSSELRLAIHGPTAAAHGLHTGRPEQFEAAMRALRAADPGRVLVASCVTRSSCRSLRALVDRWGRGAVAGWAVVWPRVSDAWRARAASMVPRLGIAMPHVLRAVKHARSGGVAVVMIGIPLCVTGPFAAHRLPPEGASPRGGRYPKRCEGCSARAECPGLDPWYLERFGAAELHPVAAVPRAPLGPALARGLERAGAEGERTLA